MVLEGTVTRVDGPECAVETEQGTFVCNVRGKLIGRASKEGYANPIAVGDRARFTLEDDGRGVIEELFERQSRLVR